MSILECIIIQINIPPCILRNFSRVPGLGTASSPETSQDLISSCAYNQGSLHACTYMHNYTYIGMGGGGGGGGGKSIYIYNYYNIYIYNYIYTCMHDGIYISNYNYNHMGQFPRKCPSFITL